jgi:hypothetical protein
LTAFNTNPGSGGPLFDADTEGSAQWVINKMGWGAAGSGQRVSMAQPLPVQPGTGVSFPVGGNAASGAAISGNPVLGGWTFTSTLPTVTTGQAVNAQSTARGELLVSLSTGGVAPAVKAASTAAAAADPAQVVSFAAANSATKIGDGTNNAAIKAASTAAAAADPSIVVNISPNSPAHPVTATQAVGSAATRWFAQISDGTNSPAVKAASTAAAAADPAMTVALSPNSGLAPTTNALHACTPAIQAALTVANVKASAGSVYGMSIANLTASTVYIQFYNTAGTPTLGTGVVWFVPVPANGFVFAPAGAIALANHATGIGIGASTTATSTGTPTTAPAVTIFYK